MAALERAVARLLPRGRLPASARRRIARQVRSRLVDTLHGLGYARAAVQVTERQPGADTSFVVLVARVTEGPRFRIGALDVTGVGPQIRLQALRRVRLRSGQLFDGADLRRSRAGIATVLADRGHAFVQVTVVRVPHARKPLLDVTFRVRPGPRVKVGRIVVQGASPTGALLVRRALLLRRGSAYHRTTLVQALARLRRTGAFQSLRLTESPLAPALVQLTVTVVEAQP
jgi:outer membrane protein insertion porin family